MDETPNQDNVNLTTLDLTNGIVVQLPAISEFDKALVELVLSRQGFVRNCNRNALRRISEAWRIKDITPELAIFAGITAQEEASSAIIVSLQEKAYVGADKLDRRRHLHKAALHRCLEAVQPLLKIPMAIGYQFRAEIDLKNHDYPLRIRMTMPDGRQVYPTPPLDVTIYRENEVYDFFDHFKEFATERKASDMRAYVKRRENERNRTLYASEDGIPGTRRSPDEILPISQENVFKLLGACLFIDLYPQQAFVQRVLDSVLAMLKRSE